MSPIDTFLAALPRYRKAGAGKWKAACPAHNSDNPTTLSIAEGDNGTVLLKCHAHDCSAAAIAEAVGLRASDLFPDMRSESRGYGPDQFRPKPKPTTDSSLPLSSPKVRPFTLTRIDRVARVPVDWLIRGYLVRNTLAGVIAPAGTCKSFLAVDWACRVATGMDWNGRPVKRGAVFYLAGEGQQGLAKRIEGWCIANEATMQGMPLYVSSGIKCLCEPGIVEGSIEVIEEAADALFFESGIEPALIVIDTVARAMAGANENATDDMGRFVAAMDTLRERWGATVLSVHHTGKDSEKGARGSGAYVAALDSDFYLSNKGEDVLVKSGDKSKDWAPPPTIMLTRREVQVSTVDEDGKPETTLVLHNVVGAIVASVQGQRERALAMRAQGHSERVIADTLGASKTTVHRWIKDAA